jgi:hypothetical protein
MEMDSVIQRYATERNAGAVERFQMPDCRQERRFSWLENLKSFDEFLERRFPESSLLPNVHS